MFKRMIRAVLAAAFVLAATPSASAATERIAYIDQRQLFVAEADGRVRSLDAQNPTDITGAAWSPDGKRLVYLTASGYETGALGPYAFSLRIFDIAHNRDRELVRIDLCCGLPVGVAGQLVNAPTWSPDGRSIAFVSSTIVCVTWGVCGVQISLEVVGTDGKDRRIVATDVNRFDEVAWSLDGRQIAYAATSGIKIVRVDGVARPTQVSPLGKDAWGPSWSRRGPLAFVVGEHTDVFLPRRGTVWVARADGSGARDLGAPTQQSPSWSPDGRWLAYADGGIKLIGADGRRHRVATPAGIDHSDEWPRWSPSGRSILFTRRPRAFDDQTTLRTVDLTTRRTTVIASSHLTTPTYSWAPLR